MLCEITNREPLSMTDRVRSGISISRGSEPHETDVRFASDDFETEGFIHSRRDRDKTHKVVREHNFGSIKEERTCAFTEIISNFGCLLNAKYKFCVADTIVP